MAERALRTEESDPQRLFQREAAAHHLAIDRFEAAVRQRPAVEVPHPFEDAFSPGPGHKSAPLRLLDLPICTTIRRRHGSVHLPVELVDLPPQGFQRGIAIGVFGHDGFSSRGGGQGQIGRLHYFKSPLSPNRETR